MVVGLLRRMIWWQAGLSPNGALRARARACSSCSAVSTERKSPPTGKVPHGDASLDSDAQLPFKLPSNRSSGVAGRPAQRRPASAR